MKTSLVINFILVGIIVVFAIIINFFNKFIDEVRDDNANLLAENKKLKNEISKLNEDMKKKKEIEEKAKSEKSKINTSSDIDNFNASIDILSHNAKHTTGN